MIALRDAAVRRLIRRAPDHDFLQHFGSDGAQRRTCRQQAVPFLGGMDEAAAHPRPRVDLVVRELLEHRADIRKGLPFRRPEEFIGIERQDKARALRKRCCHELGQELGLHLRDAVIAQHRERQSFIHECGKDV